MKTRKLEARMKAPRGGMGKHRPDIEAIARLEPDEIDGADLFAQDGDSVPQPLDDWADNDDTNRWIDEHRFGGDDD